ncbi:MAG TPA: LuxR C-terminal-related transcriptional regulator, partial [Ilumatobacteraceae bacterium]
ALDLGPVNWAWVLHGVAEVAIATGDPHRAVAVCDEALEQMAEACTAVRVLHHATKAQAFAELGDHAAAREQATIVLDATADGSASSDRIRALITLAVIARREEATDDAETRAHEALPLARPMGHHRGVVDALEVLACCAADDERNEEAARLIGAADTIRRATTYAYRAPSFATEFASLTAELEAAMGAEFARALAEGQALSLEEACDYATRGRGERKRPATGWAALTTTEIKVATLVAKGLTNVQVGQQLFISRHTVDSHLRHIYAKLGISTRAELATRVVRRDGADA